MTIPLLYGNNGSWSTPAHMKKCQVSKSEQFCMSVLHARKSHVSTVDGRNPASQLRLVVDLPLFTGLLHPRWCRISSSNSMAKKTLNSQTLETINCLWKSSIIYGRVTVQESHKLQVRFANTWQYSTIFRLIIPRWNKKNNIQQETYLGKLL